jgi:D-sedoheptulose 7-phosphate isomerase
MSDEPTGFLYPFIEAEERDAGGLLADLASSALAKMALSRQVRDTARRDCAAELQRAAAAMADRFGRGGRLFVFGNGGSAADADGTVELFRDPPTGRPLPAISLVDDHAVLTALANDVGFELVFARQLQAHARNVDIAMGFSTSGGSVNLLRAFAEARRHGLLTIGFSGYDGGAMAASDSVDHCLVVGSDSVHRIQEAQDALAMMLWSAVEACLEPVGHP